MTKTRCTPTHSVVKNNLSKKVPSVAQTCKMQVSTQNSVLTLLPEPEPAAAANNKVSNFHAYTYIRAAPLDTVKEK